MQFLKKKPRVAKRENRSREDILEAKKERQIALAAKILKMKPEAVEPFYKLVVNEKRETLEKIIKG